MLLYKLLIHIWLKLRIVACELYIAKNKYLIKADLNSALVDVGKQSYYKS